MARTTIDKLEDLASDLASLIGDADCELVSANERIEELEGELESANNDLEEARTIITDLEAQIASLAGRSIEPTETSLHGD